MSEDWLLQQARRQICNKCPFQIFCVGGSWPTDYCDVCHGIERFGTIVYCTKSTAPPKPTYNIHKCDSAETRCTTRFNGILPEAPTQ